MHGHPSSLPAIQPYSPTSMPAIQPAILPACLVGKAKKGWRPIIDLTQLVISFHSCYFASKVCIIYCVSVWILLEICGTQTWIRRSILGSFFLSLLFTCSQVVNILNWKHHYENDLRARDQEQEDKVTTNSVSQSQVVFFPYRKGSLSVKLLFWNESLHSFYLDSAIGTQQYFSDKFLDVQFAMISFDVVQEKSGFVWHC